MSLSQDDGVFENAVSHIIVGDVKVATISTGALAPVNIYGKMMTVLTTDK